MKNIKTILVAFTLVFFAQQSLAQFSGRDGKNIKECDCNKQLDSLNITFKVPATVGAYDIIGFKVSLDGHKVAYLSYYSNKVTPGEEITFNLLSPRKQGLQIFPGTESGKFSGTDFHTSYQSLCEFGKGMQKLKGQVIGIKTVGTQTEYKYNSGNGVITANTYKLYDSGTEIASTNELNVKAQTKLRGKLFPYIGAVVLAVAAVCGYGTSVILNPKN